MPTYNVPSKSFQANVAGTFPNTGGLAVGNNLANRHIESTVSGLSSGQLADGALTCIQVIEAAYEDPPVTWVAIRGPDTWRGGQTDRAGNPAGPPRLDYDTSNVLPEFVREQLTFSQAVNVGLTVIVN